MENYEFYYKDVWDRTLDSIKADENQKIKDEDFLFLSRSRLSDCNETTATIKTQYEVDALVLNSHYKDTIKIHLSIILGRDVNVYIASEKVLPSSQDNGYVHENIYVSKIIEPEYTFANFVIGKSNSQAHVACLTCATNPGLTYNPLFIYGNSGLGKTHLLKAVANRFKETELNKKMIYTDASSFVDAVYEASKSKTLDKLKQYFYDADLLIVDDIQFLSGNKEKSQEIFFSIFTELVNNKKQIFLAADKKPEEIVGLEERIITRFNQGLVVPISAPEYETSYQIVMNKFKDKNISDSVSIDDEVISFIAVNFSQNVRALEGAVNRILFVTSFVDKADHIDMRVARSALVDLLKEVNDDLNVGRIKKEVCNFYNISVQQLCSQARTKTLTIPRQIAMYLCRRHLDTSFETIGLEFGNRDHSTVMSSCSKIAQLIEVDAAYKAAVTEIEGRLFQQKN